MKPTGTDGDIYRQRYNAYLNGGVLSLYSVAIPLVTKDDIRDFFCKCLSNTANLASAITKTLKSKGALANSPVIAPPEKVDFVTHQNFLGTFWGDVRPLHGIQIGHLYGCINDIITSRALIIGFSQGVKDEKIRKYLIRGKNLDQKHIEQLSEKLTGSNLPVPSTKDHLVTPSTIPPFSDKLMVFHKIDMFSMRFREYANAVSLDGRKDISTMYAKMQVDVALYVEDGANIMIDHGWMEQPPLTIDRNELVSKS